MQNITDLAEKVNKIANLLPTVEQNLKDRGEVPDFPITSLPDFNRKIWGISKGLTVIGARTSQGKSSLALQIAYDIASMGKPTLFLSLEMLETDLIERLFCNIMMVDNYEMLTGQFNKSEEYQNKWKEFCEKIANVPLLITCGIGKDFEEIILLISKLHKIPSAIFVDYVQSIKQGDREREKLNEYIRSFRQLCLEKGIAGVLVSQINRRINEDTKEPSLECLKGTGVLEEHSSKVILLHWENFYTHKEDNYNTFKIILAKNSGGRTGDHYVHYAPEYYKFSEVVKDQELMERSKSIFGGEIISRGVYED